MIIDWLYEYYKVESDDGEEGSPIKLKYLVQVRLALTGIAAWPYKELGNAKLNSYLSKYNVLLIFYASVLPVLGILYMWFYRERLTFLDLGHIYLTIVLDLLYWVSSVCGSLDSYLITQRIVLSRTNKYRQTVKELLENFHLFYIKNKSEYARKTYNQINVLSKIFTIFLFSQMVIGISFFNFMPWYNNYAKGMFGENRPPNSSFEHAVYYYSPIEEIYTTMNGYWFLFTFNLYQSYNVSAGLCIFDLFLCLIVFQIWGHFKILINNLQAFPLPQMRPGDSIQTLNYSNEENVQIRQLLADNIAHHNVIIKFVEKFSNAFSEYLFLFYAFHLVTECVLLLEVSKLSPEALAKYGPLTVNVFQQLIQVSVICEIVSTKSDELVDVVYLLPWEYMNKSNARSVRLFLLKVQTPVNFKACKVVPVGIQTMIKILKTSFSYFVMLTTVANEN